MKSNKELVLVGGGGHCKSVIEVAEFAGYKIKGILDLPENVGLKVMDYEIIGTDADIKKLAVDFQFVITVGQIKSATLRKRIDEIIVEAGGEYATIIAPTSHVSKHSSIGEGTVIMHHTLINADTIVGRNCIINSFANIEHDSIIGSFSHISTGVMVNGNCQVGEDCFIGSQSVLVNGISISDCCLISAGTTIRKNIKVSGVYSGNPARLMIKY